MRLLRANACANALKNEAGTSASWDASQTGLLNKSCREFKAGFIKAAIGSFYVIRVERSIQFIYVYIDTGCGGVMKCSHWMLRLWLELVARHSAWGPSGNRANSFSSTVKGSTFGLEQADQVPDNVLDSRGKSGGS